MTFRIRRLDIEDEDHNTIFKIRNKSVDEGIRLATEFVERKEGGLLHRTRRYLLDDFSAFDKSLRDDFGFTTQKRRKKRRKSAKV